MTDRTITAETLEWRGRTIEVRYEADWGNMGANGCRFTRAHLEIECIAPEKAPLPLTETGYLSHFTSPEYVNEAGGPVAFVSSWLDREATAKAWQITEANWRQLDLFG